MDIWSKLFGTYHSAKFFVPDPDPTSDSPHFTLQRGIRQGCPLSPYLFSIVVSALTSDVNTFLQDIFPILLGPTLRHTLLPTLNMQMILSSSLVHKKILYRGSFIFFNTWPPKSGFYSMAPNVSSCPVYPCRFSCLSFSLCRCLPSLRFSPLHPFLLSRS